MNAQQHKKLTDDIWEIAKRLRGPYRPPQYRLVMLPMVVLRRLDCVLQDSIDRVHSEYVRLKAAGTNDRAMEKMLARVANPERKQPLYNTSKYTFSRLTADAENIAPNLVAYINGFSPTARAIFEKFNFAEQIQKLDDSNRLFNIVQQMATVPLHPNEVDNLQMGYLFEHLVMKFNEHLSLGLHALGDGIRDVDLDAEPGCLRADLRNFGGFCTDEAAHRGGQASDWVRCAFGNLPLHRQKDAGSWPVPSDLPS